MLDLLPLLVLVIVTVIAFTIQPGAGSMVVFGNLRPNQIRAASNHLWRLLYCVLDIFILT